MTFIRSLFALALAVVITGCASPATVGGIVVPNQPSMTFSSDLQRNISVAVVEGGESTNPLWTSELDGTTFEQALKSSLGNAGLLNQNGDAAYTLQSNLLKADQDLFGLDLQVIAIADYTLKDSSNKVIFHNTYKTPFTAGAGDSLMAVKRLRLANEGAAQANIKAFLQGLSNLQIDTEQASTTGKTASSGKSKEQQIEDLAAENLPYTEYMQKFREINAQ